VIVTMHFYVSIVQQ